MSETAEARRLLNSFAIPQGMPTDRTLTEDYALIGFLLVKGKADHKDLAAMLGLSWGDDPDREAMPGLSRRALFANYVTNVIMPKGYLTITEETPPGSGNCFWTLRPSFIEKCIEAFAAVGPCDDR